MARVTGPVLNVCSRSRASVHRSRPSQVHVGQNRSIGEIKMER